MGVLRIGLIGAGSIGTRHIKAIDEVAHIELVAVADPSPAATALGEHLPEPSYSLFSGERHQAGDDAPPISVGHLGAV